MTTTQTPYTVEDVLGVLRKYRKSNRTNPNVNGSGCAYTSPKGKHCIAGQVIADLGHEDLLPRCGGADNGSAVWALVEPDRRFHGLFDAEAENLLQALQSTADFNFSRPTPKPWWKVISTVLRKKGLKFPPLPAPPAHGRNTALFNKIADAIETVGKWDQRTVFGGGDAASLREVIEFEGQTYSCDSSQCVGGWVLVLTGRVTEWDGFAYPQGRPLHEIGAEALGLTTEEAWGLFFEPTWIDGGGRLDRGAWSYNGQTPEICAAAVRRLREIGAGSPISLATEVEE